MTPQRFAGIFWIFVFFIAENFFREFLWHFYLPFTLVAVIFYALTEGPGFGIVCGIFAGCLFEFYGTGRIGFEIILGALCGGGCGFFASRVFRENILTQILLPVFAVLVVSFLRTLVPSILEKTPWDASVYLSVLKLSGFPAVFLLSPAVFFFLKKFSSRRSYASTSSYSNRWLK